MSKIREFEPLPRYLYIISDSFGFVGRTSKIGYSVEIFFTSVNDKMTDVTVPRALIGWGLCHDFQCFNFDPMCANFLV